MDKFYSVGVKFKGLDEITQQELDERMLQVDKLATQYCRNVKIKCKDNRADVYYDFKNDQDKAIQFLRIASNVPGVVSCNWESQPLF